MALCCPFTTEFGATQCPLRDERSLIRSFMPGSGGRAAFADPTRAYLLASQSCTRRIFRRMARHSAAAIGRRGELGFSISAAFVYLSLSIRSQWPFYACLDDRLGSISVDTYLPAHGFDQIVCVPILCEPRAITRPASAGPTNMLDWRMPMNRALAGCNWRGSTSCGRIADPAG